MNLSSLALRPAAVRMDQSCHSVQRLVAEVREGPNQAHRTGHVRLQT